MTTAQEQADSLVGDGFVEVQEFRHLKIGQRVRHVNQQWPEAHAEGTGTIERIFRQPEGQWERTYGRPNVELIVKNDKPRFGPDDTHMFVADYHIEVVGSDPEVTV